MFNTKRELIEKNLNGLILEPSRTQRHLLGLSRSSDVTISIT